MTLTEIKKAKEITLNAALTINTSPSAAILLGDAETIYQWVIKEDKA